jgi:hypothetical protein
MALRLTPMQEETEEATQALWQLGLEWLRETIGSSTHPFDRDRARQLARGMRMVGERPSGSAVNGYISRLWPTAPWTRAMVRDCWRSVYRAKTSLGRDRHWHRTPLYVPDRLIELHGLQPVTEARLASLAHDAVNALVQAADDGDTGSYLQRTRELDAALCAVQHLRFLRHGSGALGFEDQSPEPPRRPKWW